MGLSPAGHVRLKRWYAAATGILAWSALGLQLYISLGLRLTSGGSLIDGLIAYLSYFSILTNILVALALTVPLMSATSRLGRFFSSPGVCTGIAASIALVAIAYSLLLRHLIRPQGIGHLAVVVLHDVMPVLFLLY